MNQNEFLTGCNLLGKALPKVELDQEVGYMMLKNVNYEDFLFAIKDIIMDPSFKLYDNVIAEINERASSRGLASPSDAWQEVVEEVRRVGWYGNPKFSNKAIKRALSENGGWHSLCSSKTDDVHWIKKNFISTYQDLLHSKSRGLYQIEVKRNVEIEDKNSLTSC